MGNSDHDFHCQSTMGDNDHDSDYQYTMGNSDHDSQHPPLMGNSGHGTTHRKRDRGPGFRIRMRRGTSLMRNPQTPQDNHRNLGIGIQ